MSYLGGCQCGEIRFQFDVEPEVVYCCHCTDCQRQSSSAFGISVWFPAAEFKLLQGELSQWSTLSEAGITKECSFCPTCGARIFHAFDDDPSTLSVKGGSLDRINELKPAAHIWIRSAQPWVRENLAHQLTFEKEPESFEQIIQTYQAQSKT